MNTNDDRHVTVPIERIERKLAHARTMMFKYDRECQLATRNYLAWLSNANTLQRRLAKTMRGDDTAHLNSTRAINLNY